MLVHNTYYLQGDLMKISITNKKFIVCFIFICFTICSCGITAILENYKNNNKVIQTSALPVTNKTIVIDSGHGLPDSGAIGFNGTSEQAINLNISLKLQRILEQSGAKVLLTRSDENGIYSKDDANIKQKKISDIKNRVEIGNNCNANLFISIHLNKFPPSQIYRGWQTFYQKDNLNSQKLAQYIQLNLNKNIEFKNDRVELPLTNVYIMDKLLIPAVTIECGFLSNPQETQLLKTNEYQNKLVWGIYTGIQDYFSNEVLKCE